MCLSKMLICYWLNILHLNKKKTTGLVEKYIFKIVTSANILNNTQIFNSRFVNKVKHADINMAYKKNQLVV